MGRKIREPAHEKGTAIRYAISVMLNLGESANLKLSDVAPALVTDRNAGPMTLNERVHALFDQLHVPVFRYLLRRTRDSGRAEDLTQETFLRLVRHLRENRVLENPKAWLFTVANNLAIDASRNESHFKDLDEAHWKQIEDSSSEAQPDPERVMLQRERVDRLHIAVLNLTPLQRECLHLRAEGLRYREIAALLEISSSTVMDAVRRATIKLAREFDTEVSA